MSKEHCSPKVFGKEENLAKSHLNEESFSPTIYSSVGQALEIQQVPSLIHHIYRVIGERGRGVLKIRRDKLSGLPDINQDPKDIKYEYKALELLSSIEPSVFPSVLAFDEENSMIFMTDVMPNERTFADELRDKVVTREDMINLGNIVAKVHMQLRSVTDPIRDGGDEDIYKEDMYYRLGYHNNQTLNELIEELEKMPKQPILADLSPKNIGRGEEGQITICDFDDFYQGNSEFALAFLAGHILTHNIDDQERAKELLIGLFEGYKEGGTDVDYDSDLFKKITIGIILYRLSNPLIPYSLPFSEEKKRAKTEVAFGLLRQKNLSWEAVIDEIAD